MSTFRLKMLPAADGDCLLLSWGDDGKLSHMVVDGGRKTAYDHLFDELTEIKNAGETLALYVLTHVDADHIEGSLEYFNDVNRPILPDDVWFNGFDEMGRGRASTDDRSAKQGDDWSKAVVRLDRQLNRHFADGVASVENAPGVIDVEGLKITMLSPDAAHLGSMRGKWEDYRATLEAEPEDVRGGRKRERPPVPDPIVLEDLVADGQIDPEAPNGSSIAFVAEFAGRRVLLAGDAHPDLLASSLAPLAATEKGGRYRLDLLKASHHGSTKNTSRELIERIACRQIAISTNGNIHGHPDPESIARFLHFGVSGTKDIWFNYATARTMPWDDEETKKKYGYRAHFPKKDEPGRIEIDLMKDPED